MNNNILEIMKIERMADRFIKAPYKINNIHEADAELIDLGGNSDSYLALTTDALVEELSSGLYDSPYLIGWMLATINFSDLAAVGADPLGLLITVSFPSDQSDEFIPKMTDGISDACKEAGSFVLGGDTNEGKTLSLSGCAVGLVPKNSLMMRNGARKGDKVYLSGAAGLGSVYAFLRLFQPENKLPESFYLPMARIKEGKLLRKFATCAMDTSDGVFHTLDTLMRVNRCYFVLHDEWQKMLHPIALEVCRSQGFPSWLSLASVHGEFELCFTISPEKEYDFLSEAARMEWHPILIGEVEDGFGVGVQTAERRVEIDTGMIRNMSETVGSNPDKYFKELLAFARETGIER
jgi:thiamine-monophosphate kinase